MDFETAPGTANEWRPVTTVELTTEQAAAVDGGRLVAVVAGAGTGKSRVLVERVAVIQSRRGRPESIVCVTFSRRAAGELKARLKARGLEVGYVGTVHGWALEFLNRYYSLSAAPQALFEGLLAKGLSEAGLKVSVAQVLAKQDKEPGGLANRVLARVRSSLAGHGLIDFDGILRQAAELAISWNANHLHICVDEFQDTGPVERLLYERLQPASLFIVGDPAQTLYSFRGADPNSLEDMARLKGMEKFRLTKNFRSGPLIQGWAQDALEGRERDPSPPLSLREIALKIEMGLHLPDVIVCGQNQTVDRLRYYLALGGVPLASPERPSAEQATLEAYLRWRAKPTNDLLLRHVLELAVPQSVARLEAQAAELLCEVVDLIPLHHLPFGHLETQVDLLREEHPTLSLLELAELVAGPPEPPSAKAGTGVWVTTIHSVKGLEFKHVCVVDDLGQSAPHRRMRYVAYTRAQSVLSLFRLAKAV